MANVNIPAASVPIIRPEGKPVLVEKPWYQLLQELARAHNDLAGSTTDLTADVSGVLPVANGGTGKATLTTHGLLAGGTTGTGNIQQIANGTAGKLLTANGTGALPSFESLTMTDSVSGVIQYPDAGDYVVWINVPFSITVVEMTTRCSTGTCTLTAKNNTTAIGGLANAVSTSEVTNTATTSATFAVGNDLRLTVSSLSGAEGVWFSVTYTRTVA